MDRKHAPTLVVCEMGEVRSVAFSYVLKHDHGYDNIIACGIKTVAPTTFDMLARWASTIYIPADWGVYRLIPHKWRSKVKFINIGYDKWHNPGDHKLTMLMRKRTQSLDL